MASSLISNKEGHCDYGCCCSVVERWVLITSYHVLPGEDAGTAQSVEQLCSKAILLFPPVNMLNRQTFLRTFISLIMTVGSMMGSEDPLCVV